MELTDLIGLQVEEARRRLEAAGEPVGAVVETKPPRPVGLEGSFRVVRARRGDDGRIALVITRERFHPATTRE